MQRFVSEMSGCYEIQMEMHVSVGTSRTVEQRVKRTGNKGHHFQM